MPSKKGLRSHTKTSTVLIGSVAAIGLFLVVVIGGIYVQQFYSDKNSEIPSPQPLLIRQPSPTTQLNDPSSAQPKMLAQQALERLKQQNGGKRLLLTENLYSKYIRLIDPTEWHENACWIEVNNDPPTTFVSYQNSKHGFKVTLPYNDAWGNIAFRLPPYEENQYLVHFGTLEVLGEGGCGWGRQSYLKWMEPKSLPDALAEIKENIISKESPSVMNINGLTVIKYADDGFCYTPFLTVIGKKYNYEITNNCGSEKDFAMLEQVVRNMTLLP